MFELLVEHVTVPLFDTKVCVIFVPDLSDESKQFIVDNSKITHAGIDTLVQDDATAVTLVRRDIKEYLTVFVINEDKHDIDIGKDIAKECFYLAHAIVEDRGIEFNRQTQRVVADVMGVLINAMCGLFIQYDFDLRSDSWVLLPPELIS